MCLFEWFKEWGGHVFATVGIIGGLFMYFRHDRKLKQQEILLQKLQIKQYKNEEDKERQAKVECNVINKGRGNYWIYFYNSGLADARNVRIDILNRDSLEGVIIYGDWGPYDLITPRNGRREERILLCEGHTRTLDLRITWDDDFGKDRTILQSPQL